MTEKRYSLFLKLRVVEMAQIVGVRQSERFFGITRNTISDWLKKYREYGKDGLKHKSRVDQFHPSKISDDDTNRILALKKDQPKISAKEIINQLSLVCSERTVQNKIKKELSENASDSKVIHFLIQVEKLNSTNSDAIPNYILKVKETNSGMIFCGFCNENTSVNTGIFINYLLFNFKRKACKLKITLGNGRFLAQREKNLKLNYFEEVIHNYKNMIVEKGEKKLSCFTFLLHKTGSYTNISTFLKDTFLLLLDHNRKIDKKNLQLPYKIFQPILTDKFSHQIDLIKTNTFDWSKIQSFIFDKHKNPVEKILLEAENEWGKRNAEKAVELLDKILFYSRQGFDNKLLIAKTVLLMSKIKLALGQFEHAKLFLDVGEEIVGKDSASDLKISFLTNSARYYTVTGQIVQAKHLLVRLLKMKSSMSISEKVELYSNIALNYRRSGKYNLAKVYYSKSYNIALDSSDFKLYCAAANRFGSFYNSQDLHQKALYYFKQALVTAQNSRNTHDMATTYYNLGVLYSRLAKYDKAYINLEMALYYANLGNDEELQCRIHSEIGLVEVNFKNYDEAKINFKKAMNIAIMIGNKSLITKIWRAIGSMYYQSKNYNKAIVCYKKILVLDKELHDEENFNSDLGNLVLSYIEQNKFDKALKITLYQYKNSKKIKNLKLVLFSLHNLATIYSKIKVVEKALLYLQKLLQLANASKNNHYQLLSNYGLGCFYADKDNEIAINYFKQTIKLGKEFKQPSIIADSMFEQAKLFYISGKKDKALLIFEKTRALAVYINKNELLEKITAFLI